MNFVRFLLCLSFLGAPAFGISGDFYSDCRLAIALKGRAISITVVAEKSSDNAKKIARIAHANSGKSYLSMEAIAFGHRGGKTFKTNYGPIHVLSNPDGPLFGAEDPSMVQVQDMSLAVMWWDVHLSQSSFQWDEEKINSIVKFVIATQYDPGLWLQVQSGYQYRSSSVINYLRTLGTIAEMREAIQDGAFPDLHEFRDMLRAWGDIATLSVAALRPEHIDQLMVVSRFFARDCEQYDTKDVLTKIEQVRHSLLAMNLTRFIVTHLSEPKPVYLIMSPRNAEPLANILRANLDGSGVTVNLER